MDFLRGLSSEKQLRVFVFYDKIYRAVENNNWNEIAK